MTKSHLILELDRETQMRWVTGKHSNVALLSLPWLRACRATAEQEDTAVPLHTHSTHGIGTSMLENCCGTALAECPGCASPSDVTQICSTGRFWKPSPHPICSPAVRHGANTGEEKPDRISTDSGKEKGFQFATPGHYLLSREAGKELH